MTSADYEPRRSQEALATPPAKNRYRALALSNDHAGIGLKEIVREILEGACDRVIDVGAQSASPMDFPDVTAAAAELLLSGEAERAILVCGTGAGACIAANKIPGVRAAVCNDPYVARQAVVHDDVNALCIGAWIIGPEIAAEVVRAFLDATASQEEVFRRRVAKLEQFERLTPETVVRGLRDRGSGF